MKRKHIITISIVGIVIILFLGLLIYINVNSGVNPPFTVVESESMQHNNTESQIGVIDTGDMIYVQSPDKTDIVSYVDGYKSGYESFGDYGSVIVYKRPNGNPVIHRAIVWVEKVGSKWTIESLNGYDESLWNINDEHEYEEVTGILTMTFKSGYRNITCTIDLSGLIQSGYLTLGDNSSTNLNFDQVSVSGIHNKPISKEMIKSVATTEIPWIGCLKLILNGKDSKVEVHASNSIEYLIVFFVTMFLLIIASSYCFDEINMYWISRKI